MGGIYRLSQIELKTLIAGSGAARMLGPALGDEPLTTEQAARSLNRLMMNGLIRNRDDGFEMTEDIRAIMNAVSGEKCLCLQSNRADIPEKILYPGSPAVACTVYGFEGEGICFEVGDPDAVEDDLIAEGYLPEAPCAVSEKTLDSISRELELFEERQNAYGYGKTPEVTSRILFSAEIVGVAADAQSAVRILEYGVYRYILYLSNTTRTRKPYSPSEAGGLLRKMLQL